MKSWVAERNYPAPGAIDDELPVSAIPVASRARCCPAAPVVTIIMPPPPARGHPADLLLCGHHYRTSHAALRAACATVYDAAGTLIMPSAGAASRALPGDGLLFRERQAGEGDREALIIEVWSEHGRPPYVVRWHDGSQNESLPAPADAPIAGGPAAASHFPRRDVCSRGATLRRRGAGRKRAGRGRRARRRRSGQ